MTSPDPFVFYGYKLEIEEDDSKVELNEYLRTLYDMNGMMKPPFRICNIVPFSTSFTVEESNVVVIGFCPDNDLERTLELGRELEDYLIDNPVLYGLKVAEKAAFFCGVDHCPEESDDEEDEDLGFDEEEESDSVELELEEVHDLD